MMYWISQRSGKTLTFNQIQYCLMRNFGGKPDNKVVDLFLDKIPRDTLLSIQKQSTSEIKVSS